MHFAGPAPPKTWLRTKPDRDGRCAERDRLQTADAVPGQIAGCTNMEADEAATLYRILYKMLGRMTEE